MNAIKNKLIELLEGCVDENVETDDPHVGFEVEYGNIADSLIANGVMVSEEAPPATDAVIIPDEKLRRAVNLLIKQYKHSKNSEYVHSPVVHALYHTWKQVDEGRK